MKDILKIGIAVGVIGILMSGLALVETDPPDADRPAYATLHIYSMTDPGEVDGAIVEYGRLTPGQQAVFKQALDDENRYTVIPDGTNSTVFYDIEAVTYQNTTYEIGVAET